MSPNADSTQGSERVVGVGDGGGGRRNARHTPRKHRTQKLFHLGTAPQTPGCPCRQAPCPAQQTARRPLGHQQPLPRGSLRACREETTGVQGAGLGYKGKGRGRQHETRLQVHARVGDAWKGPIKKRMCVRKRGGGGEGKGYGSTVRATLTPTSHAPPTPETESCRLAVGSTGEPSWT
jgi:hypothetical protein